MIDAEHASFSVKITLAFAFFPSSSSSSLGSFFAQARTDKKPFSGGWTGLFHPLHKGRCTGPCIIFNILVLSRNSSLKISFRKLKNRVSRSGILFVVSFEGKIKFHLIDLSLLTVCPLLSVFVSRCKDNKRFAIIPFHICLVRSFFPISFEIIFKTGKKKWEWFVQMTYSMKYYNSLRVCFLYKYDEISFEKDKEICYTI